MISEEICTGLQIVLVDPAGLRSNKSEISATGDGDGLSEMRRGKGRENIVGREEGRRVERRGEEEEVEGGQRGEEGAGKRKTPKLKILPKVPRVWARSI
jgi:hypothetical protein